MTYEKATAELIMFDNSDVLTTSGDGGGGHYTDECPCSQGQTGTGYTVWVPD